ncbi:MAG: hypothetical protein FJ123_13270, partial [Deltaproteobacteria bacterium]|nr:hypothetical protein [Deltaproteobacteria bacterium]
MVYVDTGLFIRLSANPELDENKSATYGRILGGAMEENGVKKEVEKQSKDARKISSLENLIPWLVHRLNTHLSSVLGYAQL